MAGINDTFLLQVKNTLSGQAYIHTLHFKTALVGADAGIQQNLIDAWQAAAQTQWLAAHPPAVSLGEITAQRVCGALPLPAATIEAVNLAGTRSTTNMGELAAPWLAALFRERTGLAGRNYAGRGFLAGLGEADFSGNSLVSAYTTVAQAYLTALAPFLEGGANVDWDLFVYSRKLAALPGAQCQTSGAPVTSLSLSNQLTTMRSRR